MVIKKDELHICEECKMKYKEKSLAEECEIYCRKYRCCNVELISKAVGEQ